MAENNLGNTQYFRTKPDQELQVKEVLKKTQKDLTQKPDRHNRVSRRTKMRSGKIKPDIF